ncbi:MAG TPA: helix-turn-helix transcriptional regulator [Galbitalea sp.]|jgi:hypothetical protein|nr:helix-turn-helix transcriptional regulator [Galbitalea sp.]
MALAGRRRGVGMTQIELAAIVGVSVTTVGHAETGRLWQSRNFWERADKALGAHGLLLRHHNDYRAAVVPSVCDPEAESVDSRAADADRSTPSSVTRITITWGDGTTTTVHPPAKISVRHVAISEIHGTSRDGAPRP